MKSRIINKRTFISIIIFIIAITVGVVGKSIYSKRTKADKQLDMNNDYIAVKRDTYFSIDNDGNLNIKRNKIDNEVYSNAKEDTWTILVYMPGTDLESNHGCATDVLNNMRNINISKNNIDRFNLLIETGGCKSWANGNIPSNKICRMKLYEDGKFGKEDIQPLANMGDANTLFEFLDWGMTNYPAEHTMVLFWDHGGDSTYGICNDEIYKNDSLEIGEIEYAFAKVKSKLNTSIDIVSFDTCSSGSIEFANALVPYADYMVASADYVNSRGVNYRIPFQEIINNPAIEPREVCKYFCQGFYDYLHFSKKPDYAVYAAYDLSKVDDFLIEFNKVCKFFCEKSSNSEDDLKHFIKIARGTWKYAEKNHMDIGYYLNNLKDDFDTSACKEALKKIMFGYARGSEVKKNDVSGLSIFFPNKAYNFGTVNRIRNLCTSPYYLKFLDRVAHFSIGNKFDNYREFKWETSPFFYESDFNFLNYNKYSLNFSSVEEIYDILHSNIDYVAGGFVDVWYQNTKNMEIPNRSISDNIDIEVKKGTFKASVRENLKEDIDKVYNSVFTQFEDTLVCLGENADAKYDNKTGEIETNFNGEWLMLGDGQLLTTYVEKKTYTYTQYSIPVMIDDVESSIYIQVSKDDFKVLGMRDSTKFSEYYGRFMELKEGTMITPIYDIWDDAKNTYTSEYGEEYVYTGKNDFLYTTLDDKEYYYSVIVEDEFGIVKYSEKKPFKAKDDKLYIP